MYLAYISIDLQHASKCGADRCLALRCGAGSRVNAALFVHCALHALYRATRWCFAYKFCYLTVNVDVCHEVLRGPAVERRSLAGVLSLSCARPVADE